jgi:hypothetical protein
MDFVGFDISPSGLVAWSSAENDPLMSGSKIERTQTAFVHAGF